MPNPRSTQLQSVPVALILLFMYGWNIIDLQCRCTARLATSRGRSWRPLVGLGEQSRHPLGVTLEMLNWQGSSNRNPYICKAVCSHKHLSECLERRKLKWRLKRGLRTNSLYSYVLNKNELHMGVLIKRGEVIFSVSFKRNLYWYYPSALMNQTPTDNATIAFTASVTFWTPIQQSIRMLACLLWGWTNSHPTPPMRFTPHTSEFEADFRHGSALTGLTEVSSVNICSTAFPRRDPQSCTLANSVERLV